MGRYLLDTNIIAAIWKREATVIEGIKTAKAVFIPSIVIGELMFGAYNSDRLSSDLKRIGELVERSIVLDCDRFVAVYYGQMRASLRKRGRPIPDNDIWIAATAQHHQLTVVSRDPHFKEIEHLPLEIW